MKYRLEVFRRHHPLSEKMRQPHRLAKALAYMKSWLKRSKAKPYEIAIKVKEDD